MKYLKSIKMFEARTPNDYIPQDTIEDIKDILLDLSDNGYTYQMRYYTRESDWIDSEEFCLRPDEIESFIIKFTSFTRQPFWDSESVYQSFDTSNITAKPGSDEGKLLSVTKSKSEYIEMLKVVLYHLITYLNSIDYDFNIHHNNNLLYKNGDKEMKMDWSLNNVNKFVDYVVYQGGDIELCFYRK